MMKIIYIFGIIVISTTEILAERNKRQAQQCRTPDNYVGYCVTLTNCPYLVNLYQVHRGSENVRQYLFGAQRSCGTRNVNGDPVVCCPASQLNTQPTTKAPATTVQQLEQRTTRPIRTTPPTSRPAAPSGKCNGPDGKPGTCLDIKQCQPLLSRLQQTGGTDQAFVNFLRLSNEICSQSTAWVCCPTSADVVAIPNEGDNEIVTRLPTIGEGCGKQSGSFRKIVGGATSKLGAWPWMVLIGYSDAFGEISFKCGGALITKKHILTAAHCIVAGLSVARVGEHDLSTQTETKHYDIKVEKIFKHPDYKRTDGHSDIAVLRLEKNAPITDKIYPACLPVGDLRSKSYTGLSPFVAGWGKTTEGGTSANILQEIQIPIHSNEVCREKYSAIGRFISQRQFDQGIICAGVLSGGVDTCQGDSGGPLVFPEVIGSAARFYVIGVVSYGVGCARPEIPGVYTNVQNFIDWIEQQVADTSA